MILDLIPKSSSKDDGVHTTIQESDKFQTTSMPTMAPDILQSLTHLCYHTK